MVVTSCFEQNRRNGCSAWFAQSAEISWKLLAGFNTSMADTRRSDSAGDSARFSGAHVRAGFRGYFVAIAAVAIAAIFRYALQDVLGLNAPYLQFWPAVIAASWYGGLGPGLIATGISALTAMYFLLPPEGLAVGALSDQLSVAIFAGAGVVMTWLTQRLHDAETSQRVMAENARSRAERLDAILNTSLDGIIVIDSKGRIESFNRVAEQMFGYPESEVIGQNVSLLMPSPQREEHDSYIERYLATGDARIIGVGREVTGRRRDGSPIPLHLSVGEMRIGGERKFTGLLHDLTKRQGLSRQLQRSEARWQAVVDSAVDGIIVIDTRGCIESFNRAAEHLFGYSEDEVLGRNVNILMPSPYREEHDSYLARYMATGQAKIIGFGREVQGLRKDGTVFPVHLAVGEMIVGGEHKFTGILHDLTRRVQAEERLREQATLARLGEMAAVLAHEVKNPLAGIRGAVQVVGSRLPQDNPSVPVLKEIVSRIDALDAMMKDLLLFARTPTPHLQATSVTDVLNTTAALLTQDAGLQSLEIEISGSSPLVSADAEMLKIVFQNLLLNAAHAMQGMGTLRVDVSTAGAACHIAFVDAGPGIPQDVREKIFTPFFTTKSRGSGLGLPTVKRLVDAHHGTVTIDCPASGGTTVLVTLPLIPDHQPASAASGAV
jgi:two-component system sensor kinase FixL